MNTARLQGAYDRGRARTLLPGWRFKREPDAATGWAELVIEPVSSTADAGRSSQR